MKSSPNPLACPKLLDSHPELLDCRQQPGPKLDNFQTSIKHLSKNFPDGLMVYLGRASIEESKTVLKLHKNATGPWFD